MKKRTEYRIIEAYDTPQYGRITEHMATYKSRKGADKFLSHIDPNCVKEFSPYTDHNGVEVMRIEVESIYCE